MVLKLKYNFLFFIFSKNKIKNKILYYLTERSHSEM